MVSDPGIQSCPVFAEKVGQTPEDRDPSVWISFVALLIPSVVHGPHIPRERDRDLWACAAQG